MLPLRFFTFLYLISLSFAGCAQAPQPAFIPKKDSFSVALGDTFLVIHRYRYDTAATPFFVHLHHNEQTADSAAHHILQQTGGTLLTLQNGRERLVSFSLEGARYCFDPNRMFTVAGRKASLQILGNHSVGAAASVRHFAENFLSLLPQHSPVIALHNNRDGDYCIQSYAPGGPHAGEAKAYFRNAAMDTDDFVFTTDAALFQILKKQKISAVLQKNNSVKDDGSLGYYLGKKGRSYANVEAEHGHFATQVKMALAVALR